jgi:hypothetical protein
MKGGSHFRIDLRESGRRLDASHLGWAYGKGFGRRPWRTALGTMTAVGAVFVSVAPPVAGAAASGLPHDAATAVPVRFPQPAHQLTVSVSADTKAAVSGAISSAAGGTLKATGANGVQYVLHFPPGAFAGDETVSMTPVSAVHGSPLGNLVGAVAIAPDGMELVKAATLTLSTPEHVSPQQDAGFAAGSGGKDFSLYPLSAPGKAKAPGKAPALAADDAGGTSMSVSTLSTYGVSSATNAQVNTALANPPFTTEAQFQQLLVAAIRNGQVDTIDSLLGAYFTQVVTPLVNQGLKDYTQVDAAVDSLLGWANTVEGLGYSTDSKTAAYFQKYLPLLTQLLVYEAQKLYEDCKGNHNLRELRQLLLGQRQAAELGVDLGPLSDAAERCGHFQLDVTSDLKNMEGNVTFLADLSAKIDLSMDAGGIVTGNGDPVFTLWQVNVGAGAYCGAYKTVAPYIQPVEVYDLGLDDNLDLVRYANSHGFGYLLPQPGIELTFQPGNSREQFDRNCPGLGWQGPFTEEGGLWWYAWRYFHQGEMISNPATVAQPKFLLKNWTISPPGPSSLIAQKSYHHAGADFGYPSEQTDLQLYMLPQ